MPKCVISTDLSYQHSTFIIDMSNINKNVWHFCHQFIDFGWFWHLSEVTSWIIMSGNSNLRLTRHQSLDCCNDLLAIKEKVFPFILNRWTPFNNNRYTPLLVFTTSLSKTCGKHQYSQRHRQDYLSPDEPVPIA